MCVRERERKKKRERKRKVSLHKFGMRQHCRLQYKHLVVVSVCVCVCVCVWERERIWSMWVYTNLACDSTADFETNARMFHLCVCVCVCVRERERETEREREKWVYTNLACGSTADFDTNARLLYVCVRVCEREREKEKKKERERSENTPLWRAAQHCWLGYRRSAVVCLLISVFVSEREEKKERERFDMDARLLYVCGWVSLCKCKSYMFVGQCLCVYLYVFLISTWGIHICLSHNHLLHPRISHFHMWNTHMAFPIVEMRNTYIYIQLTTTERLYRSQRCCRMCVLAVVCV